VSRFRRNIQIGVSALCAIILVLGLVGLWMGYQARRAEMMMRSYEWIHNERCLSKVGALPDSGGEFRFAVFGDIQIGTAQLPRLLNALKEESPASFIIQTGDAVSHADPAHYRLFLYELSHSGLWLPMFVVPGNHDVRNDDDNLFERYFGPRRLWFIYGGTLFVFLDNALEPLDDEQYDWLEGLLASSTDEVRHRLLFLHRQPIHWEGDGKKPVEQQYERLFEIAEDYNVDYVFAGNWHGYHREQRDDTIFVVNGRGGDFDHQERLTPCYFTLVEVRPDSIEDRRIMLPPRFHVALESLLKDWLISHVGEFAMANRFLTSCVLMVVGVGCISLIVRLTRTNAQKQARNGADSTKTAENGNV